MLLIYYITFFSALGGALLLGVGYWFYRNKMAGRLVLIIVGEDNRIYTRTVIPKETTATALSQKGEQMTYHYDRKVVLYKKHFRFLDQWTPTLLCVEGISTPIDPREKTANTGRFAKQLAGLLESDVSDKYRRATEKKGELKVWVVGAAAAVIASVLGLGYYLTSATTALIGGS